jgi:hypothetical protein
VLLLDHHTTNPLTPELNPSAQRCLHGFFTGILIFKGSTARRLYKSFGVKGLTEMQGTNVKIKKYQRCLSVEVWFLCFHDANVLNKFRSDLCEWTISTIRYVEWSNTRVVGEGDQNDQVNICLSEYEYLSNKPVTVTISKLCIWLLVQYIFI